MNIFMPKNVKEETFLLNTFRYFLLIFLCFNLSALNAQIKIENRPNIQNLFVLDTTQRIATTAAVPVHPSKIALVVGNSRYNQGNTLNAPVNNADVIANEMSVLGFDVTLLKNLNKTMMRKAIIEFGRKAKHAQTAFVYFSGHTVKFQDVNYLVPIDASLASEDEVKTETISLDYLMSKLKKGAQNRISIDSCYPNTFAVGTKDLENELCFSPPTDLPEDFFISFSAFENQPAPVISSKETSLFSYLFSFNLQQLVVKESFLETKKLVKKFSSGKEDIYFYGALGDFEYWGPFQANILKSTSLGHSKFSWPPPFASATEEIDSGFFTGSETLGDVNDILIAALDSQGYTHTSHYSIEEENTFGFAIATKLEQINEDASRLEDKDRWNSSLLSSTSEFSLSRYLKSLFLPRKGFFRVIVFAVVNQPFTQEGETGKDEVIHWVSGGASNLEDTIGAIDFEGYRVHALIYEYRLPENEISAKIEKPCEHSGKIHLEKSGLWAQLAGSE